MMDLQASEVEGSGYTLPPGWKAVESDKDHRIYYWNKKTGATTWKFPEHEAQQHEVKVRRHTYENMRKPKILIPQALDLQPPPANGNARNAKRGYENVALSVPHRPPLPQYEEVEIGGGMTSPNPLCGVGRDRFWNNDSLAPNPTLPDRKYSDGDMQSPALLSPPPDIPDRRYTPSPELGVRKNSIHQPPPLHEVSAMGNEYAIINRNRRHVGVAAPPMRDNVGMAASLMLPLRAQQRMSSRENILAACTIDVTGENDMTSDHTSSPEFNRLGVVSDQVISSAPKQAYHIYSTLDPGSERSEFEEVLPCPTSPRPYEMASPTNLYTPSGATPSSATPTPSSAIPTPSSATPSNATPTPSSATPTWSDPHYEEIERQEVVTGHSNTKPRAASSPEPVTSPRDSTHNPTPHNNPPDDAVSAYDLPSNSRRLMALNVTLRRATTPALTEYAKLSVSREALLLRSGVTLRRGRESLSSLSSFASRVEGEESSQNSGGGSSDDDVMEPLSKCIRNLETSLRQEDAGQVDPDPGQSPGDFKMVKPQPSSPSWQSYQRRPHAYEDIMGASQEELDWDESDLTLPTSGNHEGEGEEGGPCVMIKVVDSPTKLVDPRTRVLHHQYEEVVLAPPTKEERQEGAGLPRGWQSMQDEQGKEYYWHIPTGKTQYSPPTSTTMKSPVPQIFPAQYLGWIPVTEGQLVAGQCVKAVHTCINMMTVSHQGEPHGEEVLLQVKGMALQWLEAGTLAVMTTQLINRIRVWGIGLEDERDFGYVSRDPITRKHRCHVFRCSMAAREVAHVLLEAHQQQRNARRVSYTSKKGVVRPAQEATSNGATPTSTGASETTPTSSSANKEVRQGGHEHYERFSCVYVGACTVSKREGMEVLNEAVQRLSLSQNQWQDVCVDVATSNIVIKEKTGVVLKEHRVRYLSFLGIGRDDQFCGYILDSGQRKGEKCFTFFGFHMEPNTDRLCLALHSACQARFKRVREHSSRQETQEPTASRELSHSKSSSSLLGKRFGSLKKSKRTSVVQVKSFMVQYLGHQSVGKVDGLDTVRPVVQELAMNPKPPCPHVVEFDISSAGLSFQDSQNKPNSAKKDFPVKSITYVVKIRNYFAFVAKEKSKYICHVFAEFKVDAGTVVTTIQNTLTPAK